MDFPSQPAHTKAGAPNPDTALLVVENLVKHFPIRAGLLRRKSGHIAAVDGISFEIKRGETMALVGESGCGKTTAARTILRLIEPTAGRVLFDGVDVPGMDATSLRRFRRRAQIVFQDPFGSLNPRMTVGSMLREVLHVHRV
ncbi:MAG: ATP-binding cassette domain-containing protein, partial [Gemmatimonadota bacterium]